MGASCYSYNHRNTLYDRCLRLDPGKALYPKNACLADLKAYDIVAYVAQCL